MLVLMAIEIACVTSIRFGWNDCRRAAVLDRGNQGVGIEGFSAMTALVQMPWIKAYAWVMSCACPAVSVHRANWPRPSTTL